MDRQLVSELADRTSGMLRHQARFYFAKNEGIFVLDVSEVKMNDTSSDDRWTLWWADDVAHVGGFSFADMTSLAGRCDDGTDGTVCVSSPRRGR